MKSNHAPITAPGAAPAPPPSRYGTLRLIAKLVFGAGVVYYVLHSKMIDFESLRAILLRPLNLLVGLLFFSFSTLCVSLRWFLLARAQGLSLSLKNIFELSMIGNFFNTFMPGSVGGDVVKAWYVAGEEPKRRTRAVFTVLLDRLIGLSVFFIYSGVTLLFYTQWLTGRPQLQVLAVTVWGITLAMVAGSVAFYTPYVWKVRLFNQCIEFLHRARFLGKIIDAALLYRQRLQAVALALGISLSSIFVMILFYRWIGEALGIPMNLAQYCFAIPVALVASAVPLLPGGVGVGQVAFFTLFQWMGMPNPDQGGSLCTAVQIYNLSFNCLGAFFYFKFKRSPRSETIAASILSS